MLSRDVLIETEDGPRIDADQWRERWLTGRPVGSCSARVQEVDCNGLLLVVPNDRGTQAWETTGSARWYSARCQTCGAELSSPNGKVRRRRWLGAAALHVR